jgi:hypothetical protein
VAFLQQRSGAKWAKRGSGMKRTKGDAAAKSPALSDRYSTGHSGKACESVKILSLPNFA